jgi:hypothetical protein
MAREHARPPIPNGEGSMTTHFIIAKSLNHAAASALADWGWSAIAGANAWINHDGERVNYVRDFETLRSHEAGTRVYLGFGWSDRRDFDPLLRVAQARRWDLRRDGRKVKEGVER